MSNVKSIKDSVTVPGQPNPRVVALLEEQLEKAKKGEICAVAVATISPEGVGNGAWAHQAEYFSLIGATYRLLHRLADD